MAYTHGTKSDSEFRTCTICGETFPNTTDYFNYANKKTGMLDARCKKCKSIINKQRREKMLEANKDLDLFYNGLKKCICCGRELPNNKLYFVVDLECKTGLRNKCRECDNNYGRFLDDNYKEPEKWSHDDLLLLKTIYKDYTNEELMKLFFPNRTIRAISSQADIIGCTGKTDEVKERINKKKSEHLKGVQAYEMTQEIKDKISASKKEYFKTHDGWWKGKKRSEEQCIQISERQKGKWAGDKNPRHKNPLRGKDNGRWAGGITQTYTELRSEIKDWMDKSMEFCNYKCVITGDSFHNIHHTTTFKDIVNEAVKLTGTDLKSCVCDYEESDFLKLREKVIELHEKYGFGAAINKLVHKLFHDNYGYYGTTPYDFMNFIQRINDGEFDKWFDENNIRKDINWDFYNYLKDSLENVS